MVHKFYIEKIPKTKYGISGGEEKKELLSVRRVVEISGNVTTETVNTVKTRLVSSLTEKVSSRKSSEGKSFVVMQKDGIPDERADEIISLIKLYEKEAAPVVRLGKEYVFPYDFEGCEEYLAGVVNPAFEVLEEKSAETVKTDLSLDQVPDFINAKYAELQNIKTDLSLEMDIDDLMCVQNYFLSESRNPTVLEMRIIDCFFSENFRHTTFETVLDDVICDDPAVKNVWESFRVRNPQKNRLADIANAADSAGDDIDFIRATDKLSGIRIYSKGEGKPVLLIKNEAVTQNGGWDEDVAVNCLAGSVRDLLCGFGYSYDSFRLSGSASSQNAVKLNTNAVSGADSSNEYSAKLGLSSTVRRKIESGVFEGNKFDLCAVLAVADDSKLEKMRGKTVSPGDIFCIVGSKTGRDGNTCFREAKENANGKYTAGSEFPVGRPGVLAALERLFTKPGFENIPVALNDIGSGGLICALGEISCSVTVFSDAIPLAYPGVTLTERLVSETEERMIICLNPSDLDLLKRYCEEENVECTEIAVVTEEERLIIAQRLKDSEDQPVVAEEKKTSKKNQKKDGETEAENYLTLVSVSSEFLENGSVEKHFSAKIEKPESFEEAAEYDIAVPDKKKRSPLQRLFGGQKMNFTAAMESVLAGIDENAEKDEYQPFAVSGADATVHGIKYRSGEFSENGERLCSALSCSMLPDLCSKDPYRASYLTVTDALMKLYTSGFADNRKYLSLHEFFQNHHHNSKRLGVPVAMMLGAYKAETDFGIKLLGGRCSMAKGDQSEKLCAFAAFALTVGTSSSVVTKNFKRAGDTVILLRPEFDGKEGLPDVSGQKAIFRYLKELTLSGKLVSASSLNGISAAKAISRICADSGKGFVFRKECTAEDLFSVCYGSAIIEVNDYTEPPKGSVILGSVSDENTAAFEEERVNLPVRADVKEAAGISTETKFIYLRPCEENYGKTKTVKENEVSVVIPLTAYSVSAFDVAGMFEREGAKVNIFPIDETKTDGFASLMYETDILYIPDSAGQRSYITALLGLENVRKAIDDLIARGGLVYGVGNGFEALLENGFIEADTKKLGFSENDGNEYENIPAKITVCSVLTPFLRKAVTGEKYDTLVNGKHLCLTGDEEYVRELARGGRIGTQFGRDPLGTVIQIESLCSENGRVFGQISSPEKVGAITGKSNFAVLPVIASAVGYYEKNERKK